MLGTLAVVFALEAVQPSTVELAVTGSASAPVSATPRSLSDVARERREGKKAVGGFSAAESTLPRTHVVLPVPSYEEERAYEPEPVREVVSGAPPEYVDPWIGGGWWGGGVARPRHPIAKHLPARPAQPIARPPRTRPDVPRAAAPRHTASGLSSLRRPG